LSERGREDLARRIAYFASAEDLEEGDAPVTLESVLGFWEFFSAVHSDTRVEMGCSAEGQICADWRFEDERGVAIWFLDSQRVRFAATYAPGKWVKIDGGNAGGLEAVAKKTGRGRFVYVASGVSRQQELAPQHHVARYCRRRDIGTDGRPIAEAFQLREREEYLSTNWLEHFHPADRHIQLAGVRQTLLDKGRTVARSASFAVLNVGTAVERCQQALNLSIRFISLDEPSDPSHTGIYGLTEEPDQVALSLAKSVNPSEVYPAIP
jgi:hypothetical protein